MAYEYNMSSNDPGCIIVMIDQSGSMNEQWGRSKYKLSWVGCTCAVNHMIGELIERCRKGDDVAPRVRLGFYGYSNDHDVNWAAKNSSQTRTGWSRSSTLQSVRMWSKTMKTKSSCRGLLKNKPTAAHPCKRPFNKCFRLQKTLRRTTQIPSPPLLSISLTAFPLTAMNLSLKVL